MKCFTFIFFIAFHSSVWAQAQMDWSVLKFRSDSESETLRDAYANGQWKTYFNAVFDSDLKARSEGYRQFLLGLGLEKSSSPVVAYSVYADFIENHPTSPLLDMALESITRIYQQNFIELKFLQEIFDKRLLKPTSPEARGLYHFLRALTLRDKGYSGWGSAELKSIPKGTFWSYYKTYLKLLMSSSKKPAKSSLKRWARFSQLSKLPKSLADSSQLHMARLLYETENFSKAEQLYDTFQLNRFDHGTILRERAWVYFRQKKYKEAVGMLNQLRSSLYGIYHHVDEYLLMALIFREHCQEDKLNGLAKNLEEKLKKIKTDINKIKSYSKNEGLLKYVMFHPDLKDSARMLTFMDLEEKKLSDRLSGKALEAAEQSLKQLRKVTTESMNLNLEDPVRDTIEDFLDLKDQIEYLVYSIKLRAKKSTAQTYQQAIKKIRKKEGGEKIVWPVEDELWADEVRNYRAVMENLCLR